MKKVYQEIIMEFWVDDDVDIDEVLFEMDIDIKDTTGKIDDGDIDWEYRHYFDNSSRIGAALSHKTRGKHAQALAHMGKFEF